MNATTAISTPTPTVWPLSSHLLTGGHSSSDTQASAAPGRFSTTDHHTDGTHSADVGGGRSATTANVETTPNDRPLSSHLLTGGQGRYDTQPATAPGRFSTTDQRTCDTQSLAVGGGRSATTATAGPKPNESALSSHLLTGGQRRHHTHPPSAPGRFSTTDQQPSDTQARDVGGGRSHNTNTIKGKP